MQSHRRYRHRRLAALAVLAVFAIVAGLVAGAERDEPEPRRDDPRQDQGARPPPVERDVGELLVMSFDGTRPPAYILRRLRRGEGSGVILFAKNAPDAGVLRALTSELQRAAGGRALVATDQEGGATRTLPFAEPSTGQPGLTTPQDAARAAGAGARELRALGVNVVLAPVADVASAPGSVVAGRAYPGDARAVARSVAAASRAMRDSGVAATLKHFPGIGAATANTDDGSVTIGSTRGVLTRDERPFGAGIRAGAGLVMSSHALYPALDPDRIASQSPAVLRLLRDRLRFQGAVITDSIEAQAVLDRSGVAEAAERSVAAGNDLVLMTGSGSWKLVYPRLLRRARRDPGFRARVRRAAGRVRALKRSLSSAG